MSDVMEPKLERTTEFVMSSVQASPETPVLFVRLAGSGTLAEYDGSLTLARLDDIERLIRKTREAAYDEIQEYVVAHAFDTTVGRKIDDFITERLKALASE